MSDRYPNYTRLTGTRLYRELHKQIRLDQEQRETNGAWREDDIENLVWEDTDDDVSDIFLVNKCGSGEREPIYGGAYSMQNLAQFRYQTSKEAYRAILSQLHAEADPESSYHLKELGFSLSREELTDLRPILWPRLISTLPHYKVGQFKRVLQVGDYWFICPKGPIGTHPQNQRDMAFTIDTKFDRIGNPNLTYPIFPDLSFVYKGASISDATFVGIVYSAALLGADGERNIACLLISENNEENMFSFLKSASYYNKKLVDYKVITNLNNSNSDTVCIKPRDFYIREEYNDILDDLDVFFSTRHLYDSMDLVKRRGYLLLGSPGNGKTLFSQYITYRYDWIKTYTLTITPNMSDEDLADIYSDIPDGTFGEPTLLLLEDIDTLFSEDKKTIISLSGLLNTIGGVNTPENLVLIGTANNPKSLPVSLIERPGRFDRIVRIDNPSESDTLKFLTEKFQHFQMSAEESIEYLSPLLAKHMKMNPDIEGSRNAYCTLSMAQLKEFYSRLAFHYLSHGQNAMSIKDIAEDTLRMVSNIHQAHLKLRDRTAGFAR